MNNYENMSAADLRLIAREYNMPGAWKANKSQMIAWLNENVTEDEEPETEETLVPMPGTDKLADLKDEINEIEEEEIDEETQDEIEEEEPQIEEEINNEPETKETTTEIAAKKNILNAYNWIMGGNENDVSDGNKTEDEFKDWIENEAFDEILDEALTTRYGDGISGGNAPSCMRKVTKEFCARYLLTLFHEDGHEIDPEIKPAQKGHAAPKRGALIEFNGKEQNICAWGKELGISANTLYGRIYNMGWTIEEAFTTPAGAKRQKKKDQEEA